MLIGLRTKAQPHQYIFQVQPTVLNFGEVNEKQEKVMEFTITAQQAGAVQIYQPFKTYGEQAFRIEPSDTLLIFENPVPRTRTVKVYFKPTQNVLYKASLIIEQYIHSSGGVNPICYLVTLTGQGKFSRSYYSGTQNLEEEALKIALKSRVNQGYQQLSYNVARDNMYGSIDNVNDSVTCIYTSRKARFNSRQGASSNNFNTEHTFPQGFFNSDLPMVSDLFHLFPTDEAANGSRGNLPFGVATPPYVQPAINAPSLNGGGRYEPQDLHKGNAARAMMYFVLKYQDYNNFFAPQETILRQWAQAFPPTRKDTLRNHAISLLQNNRNPFIDYPQLARRITRLSGLSVKDSVRKVGLTRRNFVFLVYDTSSIVIWNEGNAPLRIRNVHFRSPTRRTLLYPADTAFSIQPNEVKELFFVRNGFGEPSDSLIFNSNDPNNRVVSLYIGNFITSLKPKTYPEFSLAPNPATSYLELKSDQITSTIKATIFNASGQNFNSTKLNFENGKAKLDIQNLPAGVYMLLLQSEGYTPFYKQFLKLSK